MIKSLERRRRGRRLELYKRTMITNNKVFFLRLRAELLFVISVFFFLYYFGVENFDMFSIILRLSAFVADITADDNRWSA